MIVTMDLITTHVIGYKCDFMGLTITLGLLATCDQWILQVVYKPSGDLLHMNAYDPFRCISIFFRLMSCSCKMVSGDVS